MDFFVNLPWPFVCVLLVTSLVTMNYTRLTSGLPGAFRRGGEGGGLSGMLMTIGLVALAVVLIPQGQLGIGGLFQQQSRTGSPTPAPRPLVEAPPAATPPGHRSSSRTNIFDEEFVDLQGRERGSPSSARTKPETYSPNVPNPPSAPSVNPKIDSRIRSAERVKGYATGPDIFYVIPDWAGSNPTKALERLLGEKRYHTQFQIAGKPLVQVGYGRFQSWEEGEAFREKWGLERSPRAFRWVE